MNVSAAVTATTATISWRVSSIIYSVEDYYVQYRIAAGANHPMQFSHTIRSNLLGTNVLQSITLESLTHNSTYTYSVVAVNCIGNSTSMQDFFETLQDGKPIIQSLKKLMTLHMHM